MKSIAKARRFIDFWPVHADVNKTEAYESRICGIRFMNLDLGMRMRTNLRHMGVEFVACRDHDNASAKTTSKRPTYDLKLGDWAAEFEGVSPHVGGQIGPSGGH